MVSTLQVEPILKQATILQSMYTLSPQTELLDSSLLEDIPRPFVGALLFARPADGIGYREGSDTLVLIEKARGSSEARIIAWC